MWHIRLDTVCRRWGWNYQTTAGFFGVSISTAHGWRNGNQPIPPAVQGWIVQAEAVQAQSAPQDVTPGSTLAIQLLQATVVGAGLVFFAHLLGGNSSNEEAEEGGPAEEVSE